MASFVSGKITVKRRHAAMQAALKTARKARVKRRAVQIAGNVHPVASTPSPHVMDGTKGNGHN